MGEVGTNQQLQMIDVPLSLAAGTAQLPVNEPGYPPPANYMPPAGFSLVGGLTGLVGTNQVYPTVGASFNSFQPTVTQLGLLTVGTSTAATNPSGGLVLVRQFSTVSEKAIQPGGAYVEVPSNNSPLTGVGVSEGSVDSSLALNTIGTTSTGYTNTVSLLGPVSLDQRGTITLVVTDPITHLTDPITDLSESFRPELNGSAAAGTGPALIDVQGNIQSLRGLTANGLMLNDTGYLNLIKTGQLSNSTILAQPIGHVQTPPRTHQRRAPDLDQQPRLRQARRREYPGVQPLPDRPALPDQRQPEPVMTCPRAAGYAIAGSDYARSGSGVPGCFEPSSSSLLSAPRRSRAGTALRSLDRVHTARNARFRG